jgi:hypothetical protein
MNNMDMILDDEQQRNQRFKDHKLNDEIMVSRLRNWEQGQTIYGCDLIAENGSSGKTFTRDDKPTVLDDSGSPIDADKGHEKAAAMFDQLRADPPDGQNAVFYWVGRLASTRTEGRNPTDPGEPPLKYGTLDTLRIIESEYISASETESKEENDA